MSTDNRMVSIVDDDPDITLLFHEVLKPILGISIFTFTDPVLALEHFQVNEYAYVLVISDYRMPGLNGMEFLKKIKKKWKQRRLCKMVPAIFFHPDMFSLWRLTGKHLKQEH